jgi:hypothetical protein
MSVEMDGEKLTVLVQQICAALDGKNGKVPLLPPLFPPCQPQPGELTESTHY